LWCFVQVTILKLVWSSRGSDAPRCTHFPTDICSVIQEGEITVEKCAHRGASARWECHTLSLGQNKHGHNNSAPIFVYFLACMDQPGLEKGPLLFWLQKLSYPSYNFWHLFLSFETFNTKKISEIPGILEMDSQIWAAVLDFFLFPSQERLVRCKFFSEMNLQSILLETCLQIGGFFSYLSVCLW